MYFISPGTYLANMSKISKFPFKSHYCLDQIYLLCIAKFQFYINLRHNLKLGNKKINSFDSENDLIGLEQLQQA